MSEAASDFDEDQQDARGDHSSPTIVDDAKVAEVLKKLRALDGARGGAAPVTEVVDGNATERTRLDSDEVMIDTAPNPAPDVERPSQRTTAKSDDIVRLAHRATAIGRSLSTPTDAQPITIPADAIRGTMFGRSIHLPEINTPEDTSIELSSGAVQYLDGAPPPSQPFPLADGPVEPSGGNASPDANAQRPTDLVTYRGPASAYEDRGYGSDFDTELRPRRAGRFFAIAAGLALVGAGWLGWTQLRGKRDEPSAGGQPSAAQAAPPAAAGAAAATAPAIDPLPLPGARLPLPLPGAPATAETPPPPAAPSAAAPSPLPPATSPPTATATAAAADEPPPAPPAAADDTPAHARRARTRHERHPARASAPPPEESPAPAEKPARSHRPAATPDDPDDTLPPSL